MSPSNSSNNLHDQLIPSSSKSDSPTASGTDSSEEKKKGSSFSVSSNDLNALAKGSNGRGVSFLSPFDKTPHNARAPLKQTRDRRDTELSDVANAHAGLFAEPLPAENILKQNWEEYIQELWKNTDEVHSRDVLIFLLAFAGSGESILGYVQSNLRAGKTLHQALNIGSAMSKEWFQYPLVWGSVTINHLLNAFLLNAIIHNGVDDAQSFWRNLDKKTLGEQLRKAARVAAHNLTTLTPEVASILPFVVLAASATGRFAFLQHPSFTGTNAAVFYAIQREAVQDMTAEIFDQIAKLTRPVRYRLFQDAERERWVEYRDNFKLLQKSAISNLDDILFRYHKLLELEKNGMLSQNTYSEANSQLTSISNFQTDDKLNANDLLMTLLKLSQLNNDELKSGKSQNNVWYPLFFLGMVAASVIAFMGYNLLVKSASKPLCKGVGFSEELCENPYWEIFFIILILLPINWLIAVYGNKFNAPALWNMFSQKNKDISLGMLAFPKWTRSLEICFIAAAALSGGTSFALMKQFIGTTGFGIICMIDGWILNALFNGFPIPLVVSKLAVSTAIKAMETLDYFGQLETFGLSKEGLELLRFRQRIENFIESVRRNIKSEDPTIFAFTLKILDEQVVLNLMGGKKPSEVIPVLKEFLNKDGQEEYSDTWTTVVEPEADIQKTSVFQHYMTESPDKFQEEMRRFEQRRTESHDFRNSLNGRPESPFKRIGSGLFKSKPTSDLRTSLTEGERPSEFSDPGRTKEEKKSVWCGCFTSKKTAQAASTTLNLTNAY